jgi:hypothetical protein
MFVRHACGFVFVGENLIEIDPFAAVFSFIAGDESAMRETGDEAAMQFLLILSVAKPSCVTQSHDIMRKTFVAELFPRVATPFTVPGLIKCANVAVPIVETAFAHVAPRFAMYCPRGTQFAKIGTRAMPQVSRHFNKTMMVIHETP